MAPFNPDATCPKCGHDKVGTLHQEPLHQSCDPSCRDNLPERLQRRCERCRYDWNEAVIDVQEV